MLLLALVLVHMVSSHAKVIVVREERLSAVLAFLSSLGFCARNFLAALGQYLVIGAVGIGLVALFGALDGRLAVVGWRSQLVALVLFEVFVAARDRASPRAARLAGGAAAGAGTLTPAR